MAGVDMAASQSSKGRSERCGFGRRRRNARRAEMMPAMKKPVYGLWRDSRCSSSLSPQPVMAVHTHIRERAQEKVRIWRGHGGAAGPRFALAPAGLAAVLAGCPCLKRVFGKMLRDADHVGSIHGALYSAASSSRMVEPGGWRSFAPVFVTYRN